MSAQVMTFDAMVAEAEEAGLCSAAALFRFAAGVVWADGEQHCTWVVLRAIDSAERELRDAVDQGDDMTAVDARLAALRLRLGIAGIRDIFTAGAMADDALEDGYSSPASAKASGMLLRAADVCCRLAFSNGDDA